jgi:hypothetical protein
VAARVIPSVRRALAAGLLFLALAGCGDSRSSSAPPPASPSHPSGLRAGEERLRIEMPTSYTPSAPTGVGTDDYRCFLLDPGLDHDAFITGTDVQPGNPKVVHHVILFRVPPSSVAAARRVDRGDPGEGWTCFGNSGVPGDDRFDNAPWLGAWAPGGSESVVADGLGVPLARGSRIVMQVHYNLLAGRAPDRSAAVLRVMPASASLTPLQTMLVPAPVELPCRAGHRSSALCDRETALDDVRRRFGSFAGSTADFLHFICGPITPGEVQTCTLPIRQPTTVVGVAGHMHLLGRSLTLTANPGTSRAQELLHIPVWNFDDQGAVPITPVHLAPGDTVQVKCRHVQWLRDRLTAFHGQPDRYVVWGDGTTDEMCLGILQVTQP